ncbi:MAG: tetratricopeptide repeat protein [Gemmatales bacterium]|nr:tetratricopeptide repeat protein [Gemmatales bacterium]MDW7995179.1 tetratricopeptide repeat protein [Gemmatales bacterium]
MSATYWVEQGVHYHRAGRWHDAELCYRRALSLEPRHPEALHLLGMLAHQAGHSADALALIRQALEIQPHHAVAWNNLATIYHDLHQLRDAYQCLQQALQLQPDYATAHNNLGEIYKALGRVREALRCYQRALELQPDFLAARSNYLMTLLYDPEQREETFLSEVRHWGNFPCPAKLSAHPLPSYSSPRSRPVRVGYVSPDFRNHAVSRFFLPILRNHDPKRVEVFLYANIPAMDATSEELRQLAYGWRRISLQSAEQVAAWIQRDGIDILIDLAGHTRHNRLDVFALQPAPIQCTYLGYPGPSGLPTIPYRIGDSFLFPDGAATWHTEEIIKLTSGFFAFEPPRPAPAVQPPPCLEKNYITFGSHHPLIKLNDRVLALYQQVLEAIPDSKILFFRDDLRDWAREELQTRLDRIGIPKHRVEIQAPSPQPDHYLHLYSQVDIVLDAFPFTGHTTTCEALWMGVPVLTLSGDRPWHRLSMSVLKRLGLDDWIASNAAEFVAKARQHAERFEYLAQLRASLRALVGQYLCNGRPVAQSLEDVYEELYRRWLREHSSKQVSTGTSKSAPVLSEERAETAQAPPLSDPSDSSSPSTTMPDTPQLWNQRGLALAEQKRFHEALECFRKALQLEPNYEIAELNLGMCYKNLGYLEEAARIFRSCADKYPHDTAPLINLAATYKQLNRLEEGLACLRRACQISPPFSPAWHNYLVYLNYCPQSTPEEIYQAHVHWGQRAAVALVRKWTNSLDPERPLRIGYVSPDLYAHPVSRFIEPIFRHHSRPQYSIYVYAAVSRPDAVTQRLRSLVDYWRDIARLSAAQAAEMIRNDRIDILIDLTGHYAENCLAVFAQQPAPIQVTWLGYPHTTGLATIHYRLTDKVLNPPQEPPYAAERLVYLEGGFSCFQPPEPAPEVRPPPCLEKGYITFGSHHDLKKLNDQVYATWSEILRRVPDSRLLFFRSSHMPPILQHLRQKFAAYGIAPERILVHQPPFGDLVYLPCFHEVDIILDTFPFGGHTMTCEALWMGVPLITLYGRWPCGRLSASVLTSIGATEWIARDITEYIEKATHLAHQPEKLAYYRSHLRSRVEQTLCPGPKFVRQLEDIYRRMWREYCRAQGIEIPPQQLLTSFLHPQQAKSAPPPIRTLEDCLQEAEHLAAQQRFAEAELAYRRILNSEPRCPAAWRGLGHLAALAGHLPGAEECLRQAIQQSFDHPQFAAQCHYELAQLYRRAGRLLDALQHLQQALLLSPGNPPLLRMLGAVYFDLGASESAVQAFRAYLEQRPDDAETWNDLGNAYRQMDDNEKAMEAYQRALQIKPQLAPALANIANLLAEEGRTPEAREHYRRAYSHQPLARLRFLSETTLPVIYKSIDHILETRYQLETTLRRFVEEGLFIDPTQELFPTHFYLAYQGFNDLELHRLIARLGEGQRKLRLPHPERRPRQGKIKIGFLSRYLQTHTIGQLNIGLITHLDRRQFEVYVLSLAPPDAHLGQRFRQVADHYIVLPPDLPVALRQVLTLGLDILYYPDIGMDAMSYTMAFSRLAPVQCCSWGHPVTTGLSTIDYFISSATAEAADADSHYSERLVRLSRLNVVYERPRVSHGLGERHRFGLPEQGHIYLCPQTLFKFHPEFDNLLAAILERDPDGYLVLIEGKYKHWTELLLERFSRTMPQVVSRVRFVSKLPREDFLRLLTVADVMIDPIHFGGGNTSYEAFALGVPIVTWPSPFLRCRLTYAMYRQMDFLELVAWNAKDYVTKAVRVACEPDYRAWLQKTILERSHVLYDDRAIVRELEEQFLRWLE